MIEEHDGDADDFLRAGIRAAARPYVRAAIEHRDASPRGPHTLAPKHPSRPTLVTPPRARKPETASRRPVTTKVSAALVAAVVLVAGAAFGLTHFQSKQRVAVSGNDRRGGGSHNGKSTPDTVPPQQSRAGNGVAPTGGSVSNGTGGSGTSPGIGGTVGGSQQNDPGSSQPGSGPPPANEVGSADPVFTNPNHLLVTLDDRGLRTSTSTVSSGLVQIGLKDARTHGSGSASIAVPDVGATIAAGTTVSVDLVRINFTFRIDAFAGGAPTLQQVGVSATVNDFAVKSAPDTDYVATIDFLNSSCPNRDFRVGDEPYWNGGNVPPTGAAARPWTTMNRRNTKDSIIALADDKRAHNLYLYGPAGLIRFSQGDIAPGKGRAQFHPPVSALLDDGHKWLFAYDNFGDGHPTHVFAVWIN